MSKQKRKLKKNQVQVDGNVYTWGTPTYNQMYEDKFEDGDVVWDNLLEEWVSVPKGIHDAWDELYKNQRISKAQDKVRKGTASFARPILDAGLEMSGAAGAYRFAQDPLKNLQGTGNVLSYTNVPGLIGHGIDYMQGNPFFNVTSEDLEGLANTVDVAGLAAPLVAQGLKVAPRLLSSTSKGLNQGTKTLARELIKNRIPESFGTVNQAGFSDLFGLLKKPKTTPKQAFQSEIDWSKWNPDTPKYPELINEYNAIEESTKKAGTWMKNPDGSPFQGTPEQFIQQQSSHFKKAFPEGFDQTTRGTSNFFNTQKLDEPLFTSDIRSAVHYTATENPGFWNINKHKIKQPTKTEYPLKPQSKEELELIREAGKTGDYSKVIQYQTNRALNSNEGGLYQLYSPKSKNSFTIDAKGNEWTNIPYEGKEMPTDFVAEDLFNKNLDYINIENVRDPALGNLKIINPNRINTKSAIGNVGFFDMTNPNIYKGLIPGAIATGGVGATMMSQEGIAPEQKAYGGKINNMKKKNKKLQLDNQLPKLAFGAPQLFDLAANTLTNLSTYAVTDMIKAIREPEREIRPTKMNTGFTMANGGMIKRADGSYSKRGLWDNIRANKGSGKKPTKQMLEQERKIRAAEKAFGGMITPDMYMQQMMYGSYAMGGPIEPINIKQEKKKMRKQINSILSKKPMNTGITMTKLSPDEEYTYQQWVKSLTPNLRGSAEDKNYDMRGAWKTGLQPELFYNDEQGNFQTAHPIDVKQQGSIYEPHLFSRDPNTGKMLKGPNHETFMYALEGDIKSGYYPYMDFKTGDIYTKKYAQGGQVPQNIPVEVEGEEMYEMPNGQIGEFEGPSHEQGGIPIALPEGTEVFSKRLKVNGKSMADRKKIRENNVAKLEKLLNKNPSDKFIREALKRQKETAELEEQSDMAIQQQANQKQQMQEQAQQGMMQEQAMAGLMQDPAMMQQMGMMMYGGKLNNGTPPYGLLNYISPTLATNVRKMQDAAYNPFTEEEWKYLTESKPYELPLNVKFENTTGEKNRYPKTYSLNNSKEYRFKPEANNNLDNMYDYFDYFGISDRGGVNVTPYNETHRKYPFVIGYKPLDIENPPKTLGELFDSAVKNYGKNNYTIPTTSNPNPNALKTETAKPNVTDTNPPFLTEDQLNQLTNPQVNPLDIREKKGGVNVTKQSAPSVNPYDVMSNILGQTFGNIALSKDPYINTKGGMIPNPLYNEVIGNKMLVEEEPKKPNKFMNWLNKAADETGDFFTGLFDEKGKPKKEKTKKGETKSANDLPFTAGDYMGMAGTLYGGLAPMTATMLNKMMTPANINFFREFGAEGLRAMQEAQALSAINRDKQLADIKLGEEASRQRGRNSARGVNTLRAMDIAADMTANQAQNQAYNAYAQQMMQLLGQKAQMENIQDQMVMQGETARDLADRQDLDNFYTNLATNFASQSELMQKQGRDMNQAQYNKMILQMSPMFSKYGIGMDMRNGQYVLTYNGEDIDQTKARLIVEKGIEAEKKAALEATKEKSTTTKIETIPTTFNPLGVNPYFNPIFTDINIPTVTDKSIVKATTKRRK